jgi:hypothetical protein
VGDVNAVGSEGMRVCPLRPVLVLTLFLVGCSGSTESHTSPASPASSTTPAPSDQACTDVAAAEALRQKAQSGAYTAAELVPELQQVRDSLFADAEAVGTPSTRKEALMPNSHTFSLSDGLEQTGLRVGGLASALESNDSSQAALLISGIGAFAKDTARLYC